MSHPITAQSRFRMNHTFRILTPVPNKTHQIINKVCLIHCATLKTNHLSVHQFAVYYLEREYCLSEIWHLKIRRRRLLFMLLAKLGQLIMNSTCMHNYSIPVQNVSHKIKCKKKEKKKNGKQNWLTQFQTPHNQKSVISSFQYLHFTCWQLTEVPWDKCFKTFNTIFKHNSSNHMDIYMSESPSWCTVTHVFESTLCEHLTQEPAFNRLWLWLQAGWPILFPGPTQETDLSVTKVVKKYRCWKKFF